MIQAADTTQVGDVAGAQPPVVGVGAQLTFAAFLVVMLLVPWLMARERARATVRADEADGGALGPSFSSDRERRLWLWTLAVLVAIYSTLGPVAEVAAALRERNLLRLVSGALLLLVVAAIAVPWAKTRPGRRETGAAIGVAAVYVATMLRIPVVEARSHLFEYGLVAMLVYQALAERRRNGRHVPAPAMLAVVATALLGWLDEGFQALLPNRTYDLVDVGFNALAALMAVSATMFMGWARRWDLFRRDARSSPE